MPNCPSCDDSGLVVNGEFPVRCRTCGVKPKTALQRLEDWKVGHKRRHVQIDHDDGYGASYWEVWLGGVLSKASDSWVRVHAFACSQELKPGKLHCARHTSHEACVWDRKENDWPSLEAIITAALDLADSLEKPNEG